MNCFFVHCTVQGVHSEKLHDQVSSRNCSGGTRKCQLLAKEKEICRHYPEPAGPLLRQGPAVCKHQAVFCWWCDCVLPWAPTTNGEKQPTHHLVALPTGILWCVQATVGNVTSHQNATWGSMCVHTKNWRSYLVSVGVTGLMFQVAWLGGRTQPESMKEQWYQRFCHLDKGVFRCVLNEFQRKLWCTCKGVRCVPCLAFMCCMLNTNNVVRSALLVRWFSASTAACAPMATGSTSLGAVSIAVRER